MSHSKSISHIVDLTLEVFLNELLSNWKILPDKKVRFRIESQSVVCETKNHSFIDDVEVNPQANCEAVKLLINLKTLNLFKRVPTKKTFNLSY